MRLASSDGAVLVLAVQRRARHRLLAAAMQGVPREIIDRQLERFRRVDPAYAEGAGGGADAGPGQLRPGLSVGKAGRPGG